VPAIPFIDALGPCQELFADDGVLGVQFLIRAKDSIIHAKKRLSGNIFVHGR
jgi:hypothetical protein